MFFRVVMLATLVASPMAFAPGGAANRTHSAAAAGEPNLIGTWRLFRFENRSRDGNTERPFGERPLGYFAYDPTGHLSIHILRNPPPPPLASGSKTTATDVEKVQGYDAYVGYFGTYRVDKAAKIIHHQVEGALDATYTNTDQPRPYRLSGDVLIIEAKNVDGSSYYRELHRVR